LPGCEFELPDDSPGMVCQVALYLVSDVRSPAAQKRQAFCSWQAPASAANPLKPFNLARKNRPA